VAKLQTRKELLASIAALQAALKDKVDALEQARGRAEDALARERQTRSQFDDLKTRLAYAEGEVQRMGGYIARVQEDDVVREELVRTGDPEGHEQLVPKRKPTHFADLRVFNNIHSGGDKGCSSVAAFDDFHRRQRVEPPKHWVTY
jgi:hypothetical protein